MSEHGTRSKYKHDRCRCPACRKANSIYCAAAKRDRQERPVPPDLHGRYTTYLNYRCRCERCREAHSVHLLVRRHPERFA